MSYLDPRAGRAPGGDANSSAPPPYDPPNGPDNPYADFRTPQAPQSWPPQQSAPAWQAQQQQNGWQAQQQNGPPWPDDPAWQQQSDPAWQQQSNPAWQQPSDPAGDQQNDPPADPAEDPAVLDLPTTDQPIVMKGTKGRRRAGRGQKSGGGRAGRNLPAAIGVGLGLGVVVLASLLIERRALLAVLVVASGIGVWEMSKALAGSGAKVPLVPLVAGSALMTGLAWYGGADALLVGLLVTIGASVLWSLADGVAAVRRDFTATVLTTVYVPFLLSFAAMLVFPEDGALMVICTLVAVVLSDTGGYAAGVFLGKHPMAPRISPKKSWEGFAGSVTAAAIGSSALLFFLLEVPVYWGLLFGAVMAVVAVLGDLAESMLKRDLGIKDMSNLLPGHGGLMDRLDSILFAVPTAYLLFAIIMPS
ncbi:phosphatidate cytidylyltransferase [Actinoplanes sp. DH11]|uniref:phosphatidate cytidylyltransferase n=1 Tax=Actinoplanes sp. DH11 TaxID=2857011 RepID=UPI001E545ADB|nr:phosphatidate cytidylyltransferase [Actinoplanes sp. DH11]